jgi:hypothetical protein
LFLVKVLRDQAISCPPTVANTIGADGQFYRQNRRIACGGLPRRPPPSKKWTEAQGHARFGAIIVNAGRIFA